MALQELFPRRTVQEINSAIAVLLNIGESDIVIDEPYHLEPARIDIGVFGREFEKRGLSVSEFDDFAEVELINNTH